jgi:hypothetical protein
MDDGKRPAVCEIGPFQTGLSETVERFCHRQQDISSLVNRRLIDRFKKPVTLMSRPNRGRERGPYDNLSDSGCLECLVQFPIEILHPANGKLAVLHPCLYLTRDRTRTGEQVCAGAPMRRSPCINDAAREQQPRDLVLSTEQQLMAGETGP